MKTPSIGSEINGHKVIVTRTKIDDERRTYFTVSNSAGTLIGRLEVHDHNFSMWYIYGMWINTDYRRKGYASGLVATALFYARARKKRGIWLTVNKKNKKAIACYEKIGMTRSAEWKDLFGYTAQC